MRLEGCVRKRHYDGFRETSCILYVHKHRATSPRDDECGRAQYDDECEYVQYDGECECTQHDDEGVNEAYDTMGFRWPPDVATN